MQIKPIGSGPTKMYLIRRVGEIVLPYMEDEKVVFPSVNILYEQNEEDKRIFEIVSNGKKCF